MAYKAQDFIDAIQNSGGLVSQIAARVGCARKTVYVYVDKYPTVKEALSDERERMKDFTESKLVEQIRDGNMTAIIFYLKTQAKDRGFIEKQHFVHENLDSNTQVLLTKLLLKLEQMDMSPADVFNSMLQRIDANVSADR